MIESEPVHRRAGPKDKKPIQEIPKFPGMKVFLCRNPDLEEILPGPEARRTLIEGNSFSPFSIHGPGLEKRKTGK
jgi:hypothetical protein